MLRLRREAADEANASARSQDDRDNQGTSLAFQGGILGHTGFGGQELFRKKQDLWLALTIEDQAGIDNL